MSKVYRVFVEKKPAFDWESGRLLADIRGFLDLKAESVRVFNAYDLEDVDESRLQSGLETVLSEPPQDKLWREALPPLAEGTLLFAYEALPGQFDMRADSCAQCLQLLWGGARPLVRYMRVIAVTGMDEEGLEKLKGHLINPVDSRETTLEKPETLHRHFDAPEETPVCHGFNELDEDGLRAFLKDYDLAMDLDDLQVLRSYMRTERRDPTLAELRVIDTYWSDHCRHTTFSTRLDTVDIQDERVQRAYQAYLAVKGDKPVTLMGMATAGMKALKKAGKLPRLDDSEEINACTVKITVKTESGEEPWLLLFKNETHNHPTEIEPFGGAATCLGGAIRDPLSGRAYVYQAMRVTGAADPRASLKDTLPGKLPQRVLTTTAAAGYSSYGNQIGLATGFVNEIYHPGYAAKRMEIGAVVGAAPQGHVVREVPAAGDVVLLIGGRTGRDGIGGATGSSKTHKLDSVSTCAAQVQKGNAPEERKLQRLFLDPEVTQKIKRCNDFGAGGVAVAIGELADGLRIDLSRVPKKYEGLGATELAISESQERMAVVVRAEDADYIIAKAAGENLEATHVADITAEPRMCMVYDGKTVVDLSREFLNSNGAVKSAAVSIPAVEEGPELQAWEDDSLTLAERMLLLCSDLNYCSQKGLVERFDGSIGAASVLMPHGGQNMLTPAQVMAALLPTTGATTASVMSYGFDPYLTSADPFMGAASAVVTSVAKLVAAGVDVETMYLTLQEYFPRLKDDPERWGLPTAALLGAFSAQMGLEIAAIGGKDSMSGSFEALDVPPTLCSFAIGTAQAKDLLTPEFKGAGHPVYMLFTPSNLDGTSDYKGLKAMWGRVHSLAQAGTVLSGWAMETGGVAGGVIKMALGNGVGFAFSPKFNDIFAAPLGAVLVESMAPIEGAVLVGQTQEKSVIEAGDAVVPLASLRTAWESVLEPVFPVAPRGARKPWDGEADHGAVPAPLCTTAPKLYAGAKLARPKAVIPAFPGTNCELDTARAVRAAGGEAEVVMIRNQQPQWLEESTAALYAALSDAQMLILPGGFSGGDEPDGSAKFIVSLFKGERMTEAVSSLLARDGLILGICNGFQALVKLGLLPYGDIVTAREDDPTLTFNTLGRHQSRYVYTRVASTLSPWLSRCESGQVFSVPISHGEGRFAANTEWLERLQASGCIAQQYCDAAGVPSMDIRHNPNGSAWAIEAVTSPDGRVLGKMGHSERRGALLAKNIAGDKFQPIFEGGVEYFK